MSYLVSATFESLARATKQLVLPSRCLACRRLVATDGGLCGSCFADMTLIENPICEVTGSPFSFELGGSITNPEVFTNPPVYRKLRAATLYQGTARKLITDFKFHDRLDMSDRLAQWMVNIGNDCIADADILVPVPLHTQRLFQRRYNQAAELVKSISHLTGKPYTLDTLKRIRPTKQQTQLDHHQRELNVRDAFSVQPGQKHQIKDQKVLLVDDVVTTGATITACIRALLREQATYVDVLTFAKVVDDPVNTI